MGKRVEKVIIKHKILYLVSLSPVDICKNLIAILLPVLQTLFGHKLIFIFCLPKSFVSKRNLFEARVKETFQLKLSDKINLNLMVSSKQNSLFPECME